MAHRGLVHHAETAEYYCGFAAALAAFHRWTGEPEKVLAVMEGEGIDVETLEAADIAPEDLSEIEKALQNAR
jgi:hypothetical protein